MGKEAVAGFPADGGRPPSCALRTGFESLRVIGIANSPYWGGWGKDFEDLGNANAQPVHSAFYELCANGLGFR